MILDWMAHKRKQRTPFLFILCFYKKCIKLLRGAANRNKSKVLKELCVMETFTHEYFH